eukprot:TRINITY_DN5080_c0_g2_i1.p1 TRINITY_DN5080_c0_g2~~TRINITY_DN5080_c0_g2_i1.p1  ORF type:complete len:336 (+),score=68.32 TRINITY_DN5080_c0_g2_i1:97-1008(+)
MCSGAYMEWSQDSTMHLLRYAASAYYTPASIQAWNCEYCTTEFTYSGDFWSDETDTYGFIGYDRAMKSIILAFRGTDSDSLPNWITNLSNGLLVPWANNPTAKVHSGFYRAYTSIQSQVKQQLLAAVAQYPNATVILAGHSLGGALSIMAAMDIYYNTTVPIHEIYNYGSPRVGNNEFAQLYESLPMGKATFRIVNQADIVPHLPPLGLKYYHVPREVWFNDDVFTLCSETEGEDDTCSDGFPFTNSVRDHLISSYFMIQNGPTTTTSRAVVFSAASSSAFTPSAAALLLALVATVAVLAGVL